MPSKDYPKTEEQASQSQASQPPAEPQGADMQKLLTTLDKVFSTFREQLQGEAPKPFEGAAQIAVDVFNDIVAGLKFLPRALTITARVLSPTEIELTWTDDTNNADGYRVERCRGYDCQDLEEIARLPSSVRSFKDDTVSDRTTYRYRVVAFNARGETSTNIVNVTPATRRD